MSTPQAKRRRLNDATNTLKKPFKSPFRHLPTPNPSSDPPSSDPPEQGASTATAPTSVPTPISGNAPDQAHQPTTLTGPSTPGPASKSTPFPTRTTRLPTSALSKTPLTNSLHRNPSKPTLTREIMQVRNEIQILKQAQGLATSTQDDDLVELIDRWRTASRAAAEELFATTRDRVNRMGGVGAWQARERESKDRRREWDREAVEAERVRVREEMEERGEGRDEYGEMDLEGGDGDERQEEEEKETFRAADDDSFTMDMMLKTLNIDLDLIGYNKESQRWEG